MNIEFVSYEIALELKELGFDEPCFGYYDCERDFQFLPNKSKFLECEFAAPTFSQVFRWFREKYNAHIYPQKFTENTWHVSWGDWESPVFETYEEAELECVNFLITTLK